MSKVVQQGLLAVLFLLFILVGGFAVVVFLQKQNVEKQNQYLQGQVADYENKVRDFTRQVTDLENQGRDLRKDLEQKGRDRETLERKVDDLERERRRAEDDLSSAKREKQDWEQRLTTLKRERDELMDKLKNRPVEEKIVEKIVEKQVFTPATASLGQSQSGSPTTIVVENKANEDYWAGMLRQKGALELELAEAKKNVNDSALKVEEFRKANSDLEIELGRMKNEREEILRKIKYGEELADNLSVELARARNEQRVISDRADKVGAENQSLRTEIKQLTSTKVALEKSIARLTDDKNSIEKKLIETENIIQGRIDEIWKIKKDVDVRFDSSRAASGSVELAPIVVNANVEPAKATPVAARKNGAIASINEENNFVIINLGEKDGVRVGDVYRVYRDGQQVGTVSVIQIRKDIAAADIKQKTVPFKAGDSVR